MSRDRRVDWAIAVVGLLLFAGLVAVAFAMKGPTVPPPVSCTGSATCQTVPRPTFNDDPTPPSPSSQLP